MMFGINIGKDKIVEISVFIDRCTVEYKNLTSYEKPPYFELMKAGLSDEEKGRARKDWEHSLPPSHAAVIRQADN
jgi:hypothetical protein